MVRGQPILPAIGSPHERPFERPAATDRLTGRARSDTIPEPALILAPDGSLAASNDAAQELFGQALAPCSRADRLRDNLPRARSLTS